MPKGSAYLLIAMVVIMAPLLFIAGPTSWVAATLMAANPTAPNDVHRSSYRA